MPIPGQSGMPIALKLFCGLLHFAVESPADLFRRQAACTVYRGYADSRELLFVAFRVVVDVHDDVLSCTVSTNEVLVNNLLVVHLQRIIIGSDRNSGFVPIFGI